jgi:hypothetical protein
MRVKIPTSTSLLCKSMSSSLDLSNCSSSDRTLSVPTTELPPELPPLLNSSILSWVSFWFCNLTSFSSCLSVALSSNNRLSYNKFTILENSSLFRGRKKWLLSHLIWQVWRRFHFRDSFASSSFPRALLGSSFLDRSFFRLLFLFIDFFTRFLRF